MTAIILWNTVYLERAIRLLQQKGRSISDELLVHLSPLGWEHINLTGDYIWHANRRVLKGHFRPLRQPREVTVPWLKLCKQTLSVREFPFPELARSWTKQAL